MVFFNNNGKARIKNKKAIGTRNAYIFCGIILGGYLIHWAIFWLSYNISDILLAFQRYDVESKEFVFLPATEFFGNFRNVFDGIFGDKDIGTYMLRGLMYSLLGFINGPLTLMICFFIYKKLIGSGFVKTVLFLPNILSGMVIAIIFKYFLDRGLPGITQMLFGFTTPPMFFDERYNTGVMLFYQFFTSIPLGLLLYVGTMSSIPTELVEYGKLEGMSYWQEFIHLTVPSLYGVFTVTSLGIFTDFFTAQGPFFVMYGRFVPENLKTYGYYLFESVYYDTGAKTMYGYSAAQNMAFGIIDMFIIFGTKKLFERFNPEVEY